MPHISALIPHVDHLINRRDGLFVRDGGLHPPPEVLHSWPKPNYINPDDRGWTSSIVLLIVLGITFLVYIARMWARLGLGKNAGLDDTLMSIAILPLFGLTISAVLGKCGISCCLLRLTSKSAIRLYGFQWHVWDQTSETLVTAREVSFLKRIFWVGIDNSPDYNGH